MGTLLKMGITLPSTSAGAGGVVPPPSEDSGTYYYGTLAASDIPLGTRDAVPSTMTADTLPGDRGAGYSEEVTVTTVANGYLAIMVPRSRPLTSVAQMVGMNAIEVLSNFSREVAVINGNSFHLYKLLTTVSAPTTFNIGRAGMGIPTGPDTEQESNIVYYQQFRGTPTPAPADPETYRFNTDIGEGDTYNVVYSTAFTNPTDGSGEANRRAVRLAVPISRLPDTINVVLSGGGGSRADDFSLDDDPQNRISLLEGDHVSATGNHYAVYEIIAAQGVGNADGGNGSRVTYTITVSRS